jgi:hypothetical protein
MIKIVLFTCGLAILIFLIRTFVAPAWIHAEIWTILGFFAVLSIIGHRLAQRGFQGGQFPPFYLAVTALRLLLCVVFVGYFIYLKIDGLPVFVINFFILYLLYLGFEINWLLSNLRGN